MRWELATDNQLKIIVEHEYDCSPSLLKGAVLEMLNRGLFNRIIADCMYKFINVKQMEQFFKTDEDDFMQIGRIEVLKALKAFKPHRGQNFMSFLYMNIKSAFIDQVNALKAAKRDCSKDASMDKETDEGFMLEEILPDRKRNVEKYVINKITAEQLLSQLDEYQTKVVMYRMNGYTLQEIGMELGKNFRTISLTMKQALKKMREGA